MGPVLERRRGISVKKITEIPRRPKMSQRVCLAVQREDVERDDARASVDEAIQRVSCEDISPANQDYSKLRLSKFLAVQRRF